MKKQLLLLTALGTVLSHSLSAMAQQPESLKARPNIIFILTDDHRADHVGFMGNDVVQTPNLDQLASEATVFDNAYVNSAICTPSRACYMLGQYERKHGINFNSGTSMSREAWEQSYPYILRDSGYFTGYIGKNHLPIGEKGYYTGFMDRTFDYWYAGHHHIGFYPKEKHAIFDNAAQDTQTEVLAEGIQAFLDPDSNEAFMKNAVSFLQTRPDGKPFCLSIALNLPHGSSTGTMQMRETDDELYRTGYRELQDSMPLPPHYTPKQAIQEPKLPADVLLTQLRQDNYTWVDTPETVRERTIRTYEAITGIDRMIGQLRATLEKQGLADNTILIFSSDHGLFFGEHGLGGKSLCYEVTLKVPFLIYDPRLPQGERLNNLVMSIDVAPTILSMAGVDIPDSMQGADITPLLRGEKVNWRDAAFGENLWSNIFGNPRCETVRTAEYRYIRYFKNDNLQNRLNTKPQDLYIVPEYMAEDYRVHLTSTIKGEAVVYEELFHTAKDPYEAVNLANDPAYADVLKALRAKCSELVAEAKGDVDAPPSTIRIDSHWTSTNYRSQQL
ncbi:sulfatase family protein [Coraliomargarita akajimensis]|uniref:Sulfatase n=1 Tax=Coraliomargarita akajimensis (strain DSM 45221 / IAM 15411 / JCM 23193 / KCTC 12865 / 04OKA010-24) TaxID=583355 RepID=D5ELT5_CORAD|nr:sulfatase [Coraliomargarita akajimensis]ADE53260.1 sulfatase [Coraliomargarita akajimensis DSM 45221]